MALVPDLRADASDDDDLGWVLELRRLKQSQEQDGPGLLG